MTQRMRSRGRLEKLIWTVLCIASWTARAQTAELDVTMTLMPATAAQPDAVTRQLTLPAAAAPEGREASAAGLATANERRARGLIRRTAAPVPVERREAGLDVAGSARERGAEFGAEIGEAARQNRESFIRGEAGLEPPIPELPPRERPNLPESPNPASGI